jgi:hypothetical protein
LGIQYAPPEAHPKTIEAETLGKYTRHVINHDGESFEPRLLEINGRENRRSCVVVGEDGRQIRIYDLEAVDS